MCPPTSTFRSPTTDIPTAPDIPLVATAPVSAQAARLSGATTNNRSTYNEITITAPPGMSKEELAREVTRQLDARDRAKASAGRSTHADGHRAMPLATLGLFVFDLKSAPFATCDRKTGQR